LTISGTADKSSTIINGAIINRALLSRAVPAFIAAVTTFVMYIGELVLMGGVLFKFGSGLLFEPLGNIPFAIIDLWIVLLTGAITYVVLFLIRLKEKPIEIEKDV
jgi:hypothetical protein